MLTSGTLSALQEVLASWLAHDKSKHGHYFSSRVPKMAAYGAFVSAPLGHMLISILQWMFAGRTSLRAKILQILVSNLVVSQRRTFAAAVTENYVPGFANSERDLPCFHGCHCRCSYLAPNPSNSKSWLYASHEDQLDFLTHSIGLCPEIPARADLGTVLQHYCVCDRYLHQHPYQEEEACCFEEEGWFNLHIHFRILLMTR